MKLRISLRDQTLSTFTIHHSFLLPTHLVKERIFISKFVSQIRIFGYLIVLHLFANFAAVSASVLDFSYSLHLSLYLFLSPAHKKSVHHLSLDIYYARFLKLLSFLYGKDTLKTHQVATVILPTTSGEILKIRKGVNAEPKHLEIYKNLSIPSQVMKPVKTWHSSNIVTERTGKLP